MKKYILHIARRRQTMRCFQNRNNVKVGNIFSKYLPAILVSIFSIIFVSGCRHNNTPVDNNHGSTSKIQGRVTDNSGFQKVNGTESSVQGATVILARVSVDGSLETGSNANVTFADIASIINSDIAAQVKGNATAIVLLATSINAEADAKVKTFTSAEE